MSTLKLNELIIVQGDKYVYHERFDSKTNIISGDNSTGKSSISSFIFFALGGDFTEWLPEAKSCDYVLAELLVNGVYVTVRRNLDKNDRNNVMSQRPMSINIAKLQDAIQSSTAGWKIYPYSRTDKQETFSQIIFNLLNFPEVSTENLETITLNQALRLIYVDQLSSLNSLMRNEDFDSPSVRDAIGNLLLGTYSDDKLKSEKELRDAKKEATKIKSQVKALEDVFKNSSLDFDSSKIESHILLLEKQLEKINLSLRNPEELLDKTKPTDTKKELDFLRANLLKYKKKYQEKKDRIEYFEADYIDSKEFIYVLKDKIINIDKSIRTRLSFGKLNLEYCPSCLEKITETDDKHCNLCKGEISDEVNLSRFTRMKLELEMQLKESRFLLKQREKEINHLRNEVKAIQNSLKNSQREYDLFTNKSRSSSDNLYDKLLDKKSNLVYEIKYQEKQLELVSSYEEYRIQQATLAARINTLNFNITNFTKLQKANTLRAYKKINNYALELIKADGKYEEKFENGKKVSLNFRENSFYLDGRNRFSASSMVVLKNSVRFAIFFASIELDFFRYPKFILCDNIEDKGMVDKRSKNFQKKVIELAEQSKFKDKDFQIIFTTSKIAKKLNNSNYTVGNYYTKKSKSLNFKGVV